jgi:uncharacterized protein YjbI with pentapeptide repeats
MYDARLQRSNLRYTILSGATLGCANLSGSDLSYAQLKYANLDCTDKDGKTDLRGAKLEYADLTCADISNTDFTGDDLSKTFLEGAIYDPNTIALPEGFIKNNNMVAKSENMTADLAKQPANCK